MRRCNQLYVGMMELVFLGTGSAYPMKTRGASCTMLKHGGQTWMFDCGEGSQIQAQKCKSIKPGNITKIFITHLHGDHLFGLPGFINTCNGAVTKSDGEKKCLDIYGPQGLRTYIRTCLHLSRADLAYEYVVHELVPIKEQYPRHWAKTDLNIRCDSKYRNEVLGRDIKADDQQTWHLFSDNQYIVKAGWLKHRVPSFGYVIEEKPTQGKLDAKALQEMGIKPGPQYKLIKDGQTLVAPGGEVIRPEDVIGPPRPGRKLTIMGDSCDSSAMTSLCQNSDVIVHETTLENELWENCIDKGHSTPEMAANFAKSANAKQLIITHFSQRYRSAEDKEEGEPCVDKLLDQAKAVFGDDVIAADDLLSVPIPPKAS